ncbi:ABC transporter substrate-binding protein [uncultured Campylobacter sp.]|uniref:Tgt2/MlaC family protein n=1 Tax=uncultured Campylobacter sp. TaxID=218934 RepID=UPI0026136441|nr:ABC transporter substrate-binding protein [uncultured Campylobacter sp.]
MKKVFLILATILSFSFALKENEIKTTMQTNINKSLEALKKNKDKTKAANEIFKLFDFIFDYKLMAQLSLSTKYKTLSQEEKEKFQEAFEKQLKTNFTNKLNLYTNQEIKVKDGKKVKDNRYNLNSTMTVDGEEKSIVFKFYSKNDEWFIYDVDVLGISIIQTYRSQFKDILENGSFNDILKALESVNFDK